MFIKRQPASNNPVNGCVNFSFREQNLVLLPQKAVYWQNEDALLLADLHLGKAAHFRKNGIPVPAGVHLKDIQKLSGLIDRYTPSRLIIMGDLFHSDLNNEWQLFSDFMQQYSGLKCLLIKGNHDVLDVSLYHALGMEVYEKLEAGPFMLSHEPLGQQLYKKNLVNISGHIHPGIYLRAIGKTLPCFFFSDRECLLPAFGAFTGFVNCRPAKGTFIFPVLSQGEQQQVIQLNY